MKEVYCMTVNSVFVDSASSLWSFQLTELYLLPVIGILLLLLIPSRKVDLIRQVALVTSLVTFVYSLFFWFTFDHMSTKFQFVESFRFNDMHITAGIDGISIFFVLLTTFLIPICILASWNSIQKYVKEYMICFLMLDVMLLAVFTILDLIMFYIFFESVLIPMFLIIGIWGSRTRKIRAAYQFFLYTLIGSLLMLVAILYIYFEFGTTDYQLLLRGPLQ